MRPAVYGRLLRPAVCRRLLCPAVYGRAEFSSRRAAGVFFADAVTGRACALYSCGQFLRPFAQPHTGPFCAARSAGGRIFLLPVLAGRAEFFCSLSLQGGRIFTYYSTSAAERQSYLPAKFVSPQNAPFRTQNAFAFFTEGGAFCTERTGVKNIFDPPRPSAAGGAEVSAPFPLAPCVFALCRGAGPSAPSPL